ncbi:MAG TPA: EAL domain-containing response regulator [Myxococcota bacterium]|nr:EAL domain-containing response regulator [Myxococcota bacterium]
MAAESTGSPRRLLILDDEAAMGQTIANIARTAGFEARAVIDAASFFKELDAWTPTHIALDLIMPDVDGIEVLRQLGDAGCGASVLITSGVGTRVLEAAKQSALEHGLEIAGVVSKPFSPSKLRALLTNSVPRPSQQIAVAVARPELTITAELLSAALSQGQIELAYQPKIHCADGSLAGFEALARWRHPTHGFIPPDRFIIAAENFDLIDPLTERLFDAALSWFAAFTRGRPGLRLSLNVSRRSLGDIAFAERVLGHCSRHGVAPESIILEVTETSALTDPTTSLDLLTRLRFKGFRLSIDDFGVGYSSIAQLVRLPFSELKVDKSFVINAAASAEARTVVKAIIGLAHNLGLEVTAEGVEDGTTLEFLRECGCNLAQGYHIARPMFPVDVERWTDREHASPERVLEAHAPAPAGSTPHHNS